MRIGRAFSQALDPSAAPLFHDVCLDLTLEEAWHPYCLGSPATCAELQVRLLCRCCCCCGHTATHACVCVCLRALAGH